ncbi:MAG: sigma-54-dependent Fis family transcriptional regulator [Bacteroidetes bacterium]|nr:sigma-54-dependent Fis family transcriptional regulator [Bacteroidota bacterium]
MKKKLLIIEDEKITRTLLSDILTLEGYEVHTAEDGDEGMRIFRTELPAIVITDLRLPKMNGIDILTAIRESAPECKVILITAYASVDTAVRSLKIGAYDYLTKPFSPEKLIAILRNIDQLQSVMSENEELKSRLQTLEDKSIIGTSPAMARVLQTIRQIAHNDSTVLIEGESGTGKELVARALHTASVRRAQPFVTVSVSSIPESILESELFGHEKGSFTGAIKQHIGYFERANNGTLFIDDIDDFPLTVQVKLLRVIQERELTHIGGSQIIPIDVRIICATKLDLRAKVADKSFREDLYYRLNIIPLKLPPLRERKEDIPLLVEHFFRKHRADDKIMLLTGAIYQKLQAYHWPGNVRELENIVERMIALSFSGQIDATVIDLDRRAEDRSAGPEDLSRYSSFEEYIQSKEKIILEWALEQTGSSITDAAKLLNIPRTTLTSKLSRLFPDLK